MIASLKVIELSTVLAGPSVGMFFAELGADVLKLEHPGIPDVTRSWKLPRESPKDRVSAYFSAVNYRKRYDTIDLSDPEEVSGLLAKLTDCDVLLMNFKKGDDVKFGLTDAILLNNNPGLIIGKISGFGDDSDRVAYDLILQAESGFMSMNGTPESGPVKMPVALIDVLAAHQLKEGILVALLEKQLSGKGGVVSVSLYDAAVTSLVNQASNYLMEGHIPARIGSLHPNIAPYGEIFTTSDGKEITFAIGSNRHFEALCSYLGLENLSKDLKFAENANRVIHRTELYTLLFSAIQQKTAAEIHAYMLAHHIPMGTIRTLDAVFQDPEAQKLIREEEIEGKYTRRVTSIAFKRHGNQNT